MRTFYAVIAVVLVSMFSGCHSAKSTNASESAKPISVPKPEPVIADNGLVIDIGRWMTDPDNHDLVVGQKGEATNSLEELYAAPSLVIEDAGKVLKEDSSKFEFQGISLRIQTEGLEGSNGESISYDSLLQWKAVISGDNLIVQNFKFPDLSEHKGHIRQETMVLRLKGVEIRIPLRVEKLVSCSHPYGIKVHMESSTKSKDGDGYELEFSNPVGEINYSNLSACGFYTYLGKGEAASLRSFANLTPNSDVEVMLISKDANGTKESRTVKAVGKYESLYVTSVDLPTDWNETPIFLTAVVYSQGVEVQRNYIWLAR